MDINCQESSLLPRIIYEPSFKETQITRFQRFVEKKRGIVFEDYWSLHAWSVEECPEFWGDIWEFFDIKYTQPYIQVCSKESTLRNVRWFEGVRLNFTQNIFKFRDSHIAIIATDNRDNAKYVTYHQLHEEVWVYVHALREAGVMKNDVVCCYMTNKIEAIYAFLATAAIGAIWCGATPLLGVKGAVSRFEQLNPKIIFASGNFSFEGKLIRMDIKLPEIAQNLPSLTRVVYVPSTSKDSIEDISIIPKCVFLSEFLANSRSRHVEGSSEIQYEQVPFDHPMTVCFTSGTTGKPKGLIHNNGIILASLKDFGLHQNITREDVILSFSPAGWVLWNLIVNCLHLGATVCLYEEFPLQGELFYEAVDKHNITSAILWASSIEQMYLYKTLPGPQYSLKSLKQLTSIGSTLKPSCVEFVSQKMKPGLFCVSGYGTTECFSFMCGMNSNLPVYWKEIQIISLGIDLKVLNERGEPVLGERGHAVLGTPYPGNFMRMFDDGKGLTMEKTYFHRFPGFFDVGDNGYINPVTKGFFIYGRSDETLNPKGARFNCSEIYCALEGFPGIEDSVCVSQYNDQLDERVVLFVKMMDGTPFTEKLVDSIKRIIEYHMTVEHIPDLILEAPDIPYNMSGKKLNVLVKKLINKKPGLNTEAVANPESLHFFQTVNLGNF